MSWKNKRPPWQERVRKKADADRIKREGERYQIVVDAIHAIAHELEAERQEQAAADARKEAREKRTIIGLFLTAGVSLLGLFVGIYQVSLTWRSINDAETNSKQQSANTQNSLALAKQAADAVTKQADLLRESNDTAKNTLLANSRAWVGVQSASSASPAADTDLDISVPYINSGRQPAINLGYFAAPFIVLSNHPISEAIPEIFDFTQACISAKTQSQGVAYPTSGFSTYTLRVRIPKERITKTVIERGDTFLVAGCFSYDTFDDVRYSSFCMYYTPKLGKPESWNFCPMGNNAD